MDGGCGVLGYWGIGGRHGRTLAESSGIGVGCRVLGYWDIRVGRGHTRTFIEISFYMRRAWVIAVLGHASWMATSAHSLAGLLPQVGPSSQTGQFVGWAIFRYFPGGSGAGGGGVAGCPTSWG